MTLEQLVQQALGPGVSDIHISVGSPPLIRLNGQIVRLNLPMVTPELSERLASEVLTEDTWQRLREQGEVDLSYSVSGHGRFRINVYRQRNSLCMAMRVVNMIIPTIDSLGLPPILKQIASKRRGLVLVTGPTGSGKSTTLAAMIDYINQTRNENIITIEDPIEYLHKHGRSIVNQREVGGDTRSFANALRAALRQDPDIILVGEMRDLETIATAVTAAETGHLVLSTLHTVGAAKTVDRVIDVFPPHQQQQVRTQFASIIEAVISQQLLVRADGMGRVPAFEIMTATGAVRNLIREGKSHQLSTVIQTSTSLGMELMDSSLVRLYKQGLIDAETLRKYAVDNDMLNRLLT